MISNKLKVSLSIAFSFILLTSTVSALIDNPTPPLHRPKEPRINPKSYDSLILNLPIFDKLFGKKDNGLCMSIVEVNDDGETYVGHTVYYGNTNDFKSRIIKGAKQIVKQNPNEASSELYDILYSDDVNVTYIDGGELNTLSPDVDSYRRRPGGSGLDRPGQPCGSVICVDGHFTCDTPAIMPLGTEANTCYCSPGAGFPLCLVCTIKVCPGQKPR